MKRLFAALSVAVLIAAPAFAQVPEPPQIATLTVDGEGQGFKAPDIVIIDIGVTTRADTPAAALADNSTQMQAVIDVVRGAGVEERDVSTSNFTINPVYAEQRPENYNQPPEVIGYEVTNQATVRIRDISNSGTILDRVVAAGANRINGIRFTIDEPQPIRDEAMQAAIADAQRKAEVMAEAAGVRLVRILSLSTYANVQPVAMQRMDFAAAEAAPPPPILGGEQAITATATIVYEIAPL
jgi:uncharacterized protein YggE